MGNTNSHKKPIKATMEAPPVGPTEAVFKLLHPGSCTGMFWRPNPQNSKEEKIGGDDWPRNGSLVTIYVVGALSSSGHNSYYWGPAVVTSDKLETSEVKTMDNSHIRDLDAVRTRRATFTQAVRVAS
eukprot:CFRG7749T1